MVFFYDNITYLLLTIITKIIYKFTLNYINFLFI